MLVQAKEFEGCLPQPQNPVSQGERLHQVYQRARTELDNIMAGYIMPDPYFTTRALATVERLMNCLKDPSLPLLELQVGWFYAVARGIGVAVVSCGTSTSPPGPSQPWRGDELPEGPQPAPLELQVGWFHIVAREKWVCG